MASQTSGPPFTEVRSPRLVLERRPFPWWLLPVTIGMLGALALLWRATEPTPHQAGAAPQPPPQVVNRVDLGPMATAVALALATDVPVPTPTPIPTWTPVITDAERWGYCTDRSVPLTPCVPRRPTPLPSPSPYPTCFAGSSVPVCTPPMWPDTQLSQETS